MATLVSTGQLTIVDNNDARPITAFIAASGVTQQTYTKDESVTSFNPNWTSTPNTLTAKVYIGSTNASVDITAQLSNKKWSNDLGASIGSATTFAVNTNLTEATPAKTYYFEGDYTDPITGLVSHVIAQITLGLVKTGTNAVYIQVRGQNVVGAATGVTKNAVSLVADLIRASGVDDAGTTYRWYQSPHAAADQIDGNLASVATKYGFRDTAATNASVAGAIGFVKTTAGGTSTALTTANMPDGGWTDTKSITISELAVTDIAVFKVEAKDADGTIYQQFFTVYDVSDPYTTQLVSSAGDKLQNGVGSTNVFPRIYNGANRVSDVTGWTFDWQLYDRNGARCAFVDATRTAVAGGRNITANTAGASSQITYDGANIASLVAGDILKCVKSDGTASFFELASKGTNTATIRAASTNAWLAYTAPALSEFVGGKMFVCKTTGTLGAANIVTTGGSGVETDAQITVTGDEIDAKGTIMCYANRP